MGNLASSIADVANAAGALIPAIAIPAAVIAAAARIYMVVTGIMDAFSRGEVHQNPIMAEIERRIQEQEALVRKATADQAKAEEDSRVAHEKLRRSEELRQVAEATARAQEQERLHAEEARKSAEEEARRADADKAVAEEHRKRAEDDARRADEERSRAESEMMTAQQERDKAARAREESERAAAEARAALEEAKKKLREGVRPIIVPTREQFLQVKKRLGYREGLFHFGVAGIAGSGKSSLVNAFRGLRTGDEGAAATGVTETTSDIAPYPDPAYPFVWYDIPGAGTLSIPDWQYFSDHGLYVFDSIIVLFDARFTASDVAILRNCARLQIPAYIVRSKSKQHIANLAEDMAGEAGGDTRIALLGAARERYIRETRASVAKNLEAAGLPEQRTYLVDKETLLRIVKNKIPKDYIDEWVLLQDLLGEASRRRVHED